MLPCARCGNSRAVWTRTADGQPLCGSCSRQRVPCSTCGKTRTVAARLPAGPLCSTCYRKDPASFRPCTGCGATEHLYHHGLCIRCACREHLLGLLSHDQGGMHPHAEAIYHVLAASDPAPLMQWLTTSSAAGMIARGYQPGRPPPGHADLDRFPPGRPSGTCARSSWPAASCPPGTSGSPSSSSGSRTRPARSQIPPSAGPCAASRPGITCGGCAASPARHHITTEQADYVHNEVRAAVILITWLRDHGTSLASCTQRDIDDWLAAGPGTCFHARTFVTWASSRGHAGDVEIPRPARSETLAQLEEDRRWELVRSLLHDDARAIEDRVAGLLVLLYGQPLARIARLTRDQVTDSPDGVTLLLGTMPVELPGPLDEPRPPAPRPPPRTRRRRPHQRPSVALSRRSTAHPISTAQLKVRLAAVGIHGRSGRNTALMDLAVKLPPVALARMLGIHISTAGTWAERAGGSHAAYAAQVSRRAFSKF